MPVPRLLTVGEAFEDLVFVGLERLPNPGEEVKTNTFHATFGGGAVITAVGTARLGIATSILSALSAPAAARLRRERVRVTNLRRAGEPHAITAALSTASDRSFVTFNGVNAVLEPRLLRALASTTATHVHFALCPGRPAAWARMAARLRRRGITVSGDFGWNESLAADDGLAALIDALDLVFLNELEAPLYSHATSLDDAYGRLRTSRSNVVVKLGDQGSRWLRADGDVVMPAARRESRRHDRRRRCLQRRLPGGVAARGGAGRLSGHRQQCRGRLDAQGRRARRAAVAARPAPSAAPGRRGTHAIDHGRPDACRAPRRPHACAFPEDVVKLAIIGGAGVRVPLLVGGFARSTLHVDRIDLYDIDQARLAIVADLARRMAGGVPVHAHAAPEPCIEGADFVITSIRVGGIAQRAADEATCIAHGVVGQETVGPAGFAMAVRTIPAMIEYGRLTRAARAAGVAGQLQQPGQHHLAGRASAHGRARASASATRRPRSSKTPPTRSGCRRRRVTTTTSA